MVSMLRATAAEGVLHLVLDRPERRNALGAPLVRALDAALDEAEWDDGVGAVLLSGAAPAFCAGSDLKLLGGLTVDGMVEHENGTAALARRIAAWPKPVVAAVEGYALGGGFILAAHCDLVVTASDARWHLPEVNNGWLPPWGLSALIRRVGPARARWLAWGAEPIDGTEACRLGVADLCCDPGGAVERAEAAARRLARMPPEAVAAVKRVIGEPELPPEQLDRLSAVLFAEHCRTEPARVTLDRFRSGNGGGGAGGR